MEPGSFARIAETAFLPPHNSSNQSSAKLHQQRFLPCSAPELAEILLYRGKTSRVPLFRLITGLAANRKAQFMAEVLDESGRYLRQEANLKRQTILKLGLPCIAIIGVILDFQFGQPFLEGEMSAWAAGLMYLALLLLTWAFALWIYRIVEAEEQKRTLHWHHETDQHTIVPVVPQRGVSTLELLLKSRGQNTSNAEGYRVVTRDLLCRASMSSLKFRMNRTT